MLLLMALSTNPQANMVYDGLGQCLSLTVWQAGVSITSRYVIDSARQGAALAATANSQTTFYLYGLGVVAEQTTSWAYYLKDGQNSVGHAARRRGGGRHAGEDV